MSRRIIPPVVTGPQGAVGPTGPQGVVGATGAVGPQGPGGSGGDVVGPASSADNVLVRFDGTTGKLIQASGVSLDDSDNLSLAAASILVWAGRTKASSPSDGVLLVTNNAATDFARIQLGGTTSSFPAIKRNAATVDIRTANDGGYAPLRASVLTALSSGTPSSTGVVRLGNADWIAGRQTGAADLNLIRANASNQVEVGSPTLLPTLAGAGSRFVQADAAGLVTAPTGFGSGGSDVAVGNHTHTYDLVKLFAGTFSAASSASVDTVFSATYENYLILFSNLSQSGTQNWNLRLRLAGVDASGATDYIHGRIDLYTGSTVQGGSAGASSIVLIAPATAAITSGNMQVIVSRPAIADVTEVIFSAGGISNTNPRATAGGGLHSLATAYDGFTIFPGAGTISGTVKVYGYKD